MKITLLGEDGVRLEDSAGPLTIEAAAADHQYSPYHMLGSGMAACIYALLQSWAEQATLKAQDLAIEVRWAFVEEPHRVGNFAIRIEWPSLPESRRAAVERAARLCPVHATFEHHPDLRYEVVA